jgi:hypothetical protein
VYIGVHYIIISSSACKYKYTTGAKDFLNSELNKIMMYLEKQDFVLEIEDQHSTLAAFRVESSRCFVLCIPSSITTC